MLGFADGYDSDCVVILPETVSAKGPAPKEFGILLCDREAVRFKIEGGRRIERGRRETRRRL